MHQMQEKLLFLFKTKRSYGIRLSPALFELKRNFLSIIIHSVTGWKYILKMLYAKQFLLLIVPHHAGRCCMNGTKEQSVPRRAYEVDKSRLLWAITFGLSKLTTSSSHPACNVLLPITLGTTGIQRILGGIFGILFFLWGWTRGKKPCSPMTAMTSHGTWVHVCCTLRRWHRASGAERWWAHMSCDSYWYFASSLCSACSSLRSCLWGLAVTAIVSRRHVHSSRGTGSAHTVLHVLLRNLPLLAQGPAPRRALGAHVPLGGHWPRCTPDISRKHLKEPGHGALKTQCPEHRRNS